MDKLVMRFSSGSNSDCHCYFKYSVSKYIWNKYLGQYFVMCNLFCTTCLFWRWVVRLRNKIQICGQGFCSSSSHPYRFWGPPTQPTIQWVLEALYLKRSGREADHSPPSSAEVKNARSYPSLPQYVFTASCLFKCRIHRHGVILG